VVADGISTSDFNDLAKSLEGASGRQIMKLCGGWQAAAYVGDYTASFAPCCVPPSQQNQSPGAPFALPASTRSVRPSSRDVCDDETNFLSRTLHSSLVFARWSDPFLEGSGAQLQCTISWQRASHIV
jgi:hypothetical protein